MITRDFTTAQLTAMGINIVAVANQTQYGCIVYDKTVLPTDLIASLCYIDATGVHFPDYPTVLAYFQQAYRDIYGQDVYLEADSQDGQWVAVLALAAYDNMALLASVYNAYSPATAQGVGLSRNVKINGIRRREPTYSTAMLTILGQIGTIITNGQAQDETWQKWNLPASVEIPSGGSVVVEATAADIGAIQASAGTITKIASPTIGWLKVTNAAAAVPGVPIESDAELRLRQAVSTAIPSRCVMDGIIGAVADVADVTKYKGFENDTNSTDANGIDPHSIAIVVEGGTDLDIATAIFTKKTAGCGTYPTTGSTADIVHQVVTDDYGNNTTINFMRPTVVTIGVEVTVHAAAGFTYSSPTSDLIKAAIAEYFDSLTIGDDVYLTRLYVPANLPRTIEGATFDITLLRIKKNSDAFESSNITVAFNELAECAIANVTVIVA